MYLRTFKAKKKISVLQQSNGIQTVSNFSSTL